MADAPKQATEKVMEIADMSGGMQATSTPFLRRSKELELSENADYGEVGGVGKIKGYSQRANNLTSTTTTSTSTSTTTTSTSTSSSTSTSTSTTTTA